MVLTHVVAARGRCAVGSIALANRVVQYCVSSLGRAEDAQVSSLKTAPSFGIMSESARKRRRLESTDGNLRKSVLSAFEFETSTSTRVVTPPRATDIFNLPEARVADIVEKIKCQSLSNSGSHLEHLKHSLRCCELTIDELVNSFFDEDEERPPLCALVALMESGALQISDITPGLLQTHAAELSCRGGRSCVCSPSLVFQQLLACHVDVGNSRARDELFEALMKPLLVVGPSLIRAGSEPKAFDLAMTAISVVSRFVLDRTARLGLLLRWTKASVSAQCGDSNPQRQTGAVSVVPLSIVLYSFNRSWL